MKPSLIDNHILPLHPVTTVSTTMVQSVPPGYSRSRYAITQDDHAGWAVVASSVGLMVMVFFATIIIWYRRMVRSEGWHYDACIAASLVHQVNAFYFDKSGTEEHSQMIAILQSAAVIVAASASLGKSMSARGVGVQTTTELVRRPPNVEEPARELTRTRLCTSAISLISAQCSYLVSPYCSSIICSSVKAPPTPS